VVSLDRVVRIPIGDMPRRRRKLIEHTRVDRSSIGHNLDRRQSEPQRGSEEPPCSGRIPAGREQHVDDLTMLINRPVPVGSATGDLDVGLVGKPPVPGSVGALAGRRR
jgi:hypothetical protein